MVIRKLLKWENNVLFGEKKPLKCINSCKMLGVKWIIIREKLVYCKEN
jgi:hypothetical protein